MLSFVPVAEEHVALVGTSEIEPAEEARLEGSGVRLVDANVLREGGLGTLAVALDELRERVDKIYVHLDLDVLDPEEVGQDNEFAPEGGLSIRGLSSALGMVREHFSIAAAGIASHDAAFDSEGRMLATAISCVEQIAHP